METRLLSVLMGLRGERRPDALLAHMVPKFVLYAAPIAVPRRIPVYLWYTHKGVDASLKLAMPLVRKVFTASEESFRLESAVAKRVVTGHGIDCEHFAPATGDGHGAPRPVDVLSVGRLAPSKGHHEILEAVASLKTAERRIAVEVAGDVLLQRDESYRESLRAQAEALGDVQLLGAVGYPDIAAVMRRARLLVNASRTGSVDKVVLEAMACATPVLTCNESFERVLGPELSARLMFPPGDVAALAGRMDELLALSDAEREVLGRRLRDIVLADHDLARLMPRLVAEMGAAG
jgi:glycosyltransferase involved in cell wall biosynthesis